MVPTSSVRSKSEMRREEVLTLSEAAAYLRVAEAELTQLAEGGGIPARKIGGEWRFLKQALNEWLRSPDKPCPEAGTIHPRRLMDSLAEELLDILEDRIVQRLKQATPPPPRPGSKQAVLAHFGIFQNEGDLEERLADARKRREAGG
jgi:excisionase family DNA binding protein